MKLTKFNQTTFPKKAGRSSTRTPKISITKVGLFSINKAAINLMSLKAGDRITIAQDEENLDNWFLFKDDAGYQLRGKETDRSACLLFAHKDLQVTFCESFSLDSDITFLFEIETKPIKNVGDPTPYWRIAVPIETEA